MLQRMTATLSRARHLPPTVFGEEEEEENVEAGVVSWMMFAVGGLGALASGVAWSRV
jgi:hypothetical protein